MYEYIIVIIITIVIATFLARDFIKIIILAGVTLAILLTIYLLKQKYSISKVILISILVIIALIGIILLSTRSFLHEELDDVHPRIMNTDDPHIKRSEWLWVIPLYMDDPISNYPEWVNNLKKTGKKIGLHGVKHTHKEFGVDRSDDYIDSGIQEFYKAFGYYPKYFKAPSLAMTENNTKKIKQKGMEIKTRFNQIVHTVHHSPKHRYKNGKLIGE